MRALLAIALLALAPTSAAQRYSFAVDVPADLGGVTRLASEVLDRDGAAFLVEAALPADVEIAALARDGADLLFVPAVPVTLAGATYTPSTIVRRSAAGLFSLELELALPDGARIDALMIDGDGGPIVSFDVPVNLDSTLFRPADLVKIGTPSGFWFGGSGLTTADTNIIAASLDENGELIVAFDAPTLLGSFDALPGELVRWNGASFASAVNDPSWPAGVVLQALDIDRLTLGSGSIGTSLRLDKLVDGQVKLDWNGSCLDSDDDFGVYAGRLTEWTSHKAVTCTTGNTTTWERTPEEPAEFYLVVPNGATSEGSHGLTSIGAERPRGTTVCRVQELAECS